MERKATNRHVFLTVVREVEMSRNYFTSVFIVNLDIKDVRVKGSPNLRSVLPMYISVHKVQVMQ